MTRLLHLASRIALSPEEAGLPPLPGDEQLPDMMQDSEEPVLKEDEESEEEKKDKKSEDLFAASTPENDQLRILSALVFSSLGGIATIDEESETTVKITINDQEWKLMFDGSRATLQGFPNTPNLDQYLGKVDEERPLQDMIIIADKAANMIQESQGKVEDVPPISFGEKPGEEDEGELDSPPGSEAELQDDSALGADPMMGGGGGGLGADPMMGLGGGMGAPPMGADPMMGMGAPAPMGAPPMGAPPPMGMGGGGDVINQQPQQAMTPQMGMPFASKKLAKVLDSIADDVQRKGFTKLARRIDRIANTLDQY